MSAQVAVTGHAEVTPELVATMFWELDSEQQADFFAALDRIAEGQLCQQMAYAVMAMQNRSELGDHSAMVGFQTMTYHAQDFVRYAAESRAWRAKCELRRMADKAKKSLA